MEAGLKQNNIDALIAALLSFNTITDNLLKREQQTYVTYRKLAIQVYTKIYITKLFN